MTGSRTVHLTPEERAARGKAARGPVPRSAHAEFTPPPDRADPVSLLEAQSATRVQELIPVRYGRMLESPFRFYRGAAAIMAADLARTPSTGIRAQLCGDAHLLNFRLLASAERHLMFDINDFDETLPGPWEWDVKRLAASLAMAGRSNGFTDAERSGVVRAAVGSYRTWMGRFAGMRNLEVWYARIDADELYRTLTERSEEGVTARTSRSLAKARGKDHLHAFEKLTHLVKGERRITPDHPLITPIDVLLPDAERASLEEQMRRLVDQYGESLPSDRRALLRQFRLVDMARKVVGVGSVGTRCWIILMLGRDDHDPLLLQAKEAQNSVLAEYAGPSEFESQGQRVVAGQRLMQASSDILLGWERTEGIDGRERDFYVRQLHDWKGIALVDSMKPPTLKLFGRVCGASLARAHARSGDRIAIAAYLGRGDAFDLALAEFAEAYADQNERDFDALGAAVRSGRVRAGQL
ncbi:DUF2252 domain-containing protein [Streptomyces sp. A7024]|uniref:DUF2252 domain-containing protein n=1 Tax=Streptomyces coryli TaxID=1128680 RepID=A0A6G4TRK6_9ACTN|nr:DUF2252 domain-containing protein [Streptomyces coryli]NGN62625.1 DUF2252 domain-containing protein [Streptomyces coryli]